MNNKKGFATTSIHAGHHKNAAGALSLPIYQTSTFVFDSTEQGGRRFAGEEEGYIYSRLGNPTNTSLEQKVAALEGGEAAASTASGMGAISSALWTALKAGDHVLACDTLYGCTQALLSKGLTKFGIEVDFVDLSNLDLMKEKMKDNTRVVYLETPANPTLKICDIEAISKIAHEKEGTIVMVDNTFCSPYIQRPLELGADVVLHSATKYLNGHGDVIAGFVVGSSEFITAVKMEGIKDFTGAVLSPNDAFLINRGHPAIESILYPGLKDFPQYDLAKKQMSLPGAMISFEVKGGIEAGAKLMNTLELCTLAVSLGDAETLIEHPASMTHSPCTPEERAAANITDGLVRLSVGLEDADDIIADLKQALDKLV